MRDKELKIDCEYFDKQQTGEVSSLGGAVDAVFSTVCHLPGSPNDPPSMDFVEKCADCPHNKWQEEQ